MDEKIEKIVEWLQNKVETTGVKGLLVGISGGLDSAVVAHLIKRACPDHSLGVIMPCYSKASDLNHANRVVETSGINSLNIDLTDTHKQLFHQIKSETSTEWNVETERMSDANLRARLRMSTLYTLASNHRYLVVGTDNLAEWYTGYFTKFGDGGVDLQPLASLLKEDVWSMATYLGVPEEVIKKMPSADLWEGQTDETEMGVSYVEIDAYLKGESIPEQSREIIENMHRRTQHKREIAAQCILDMKN